MTDVAIVTDSTHYLPRELTQARGIAQVSLYVGWTDEVIRELDMDDYTAFYARLARDPALPSTSQPSIGDFLSIWEPLLDAGKDIVSVHLSGGISGTYDAARQAQSMLAERGIDGRVQVLDSETGCGGMGLLLLAGANAASDGSAMATVAERIKRARAGLTMWFCIDTLEYLQRGGRIGKAQAWLGGALKIKPILTLGAEITPVERVRTSGRAFERLLVHAQELHDRGCDGWAVQHIQAHEQAARLAARCRDIFGCEPLFVSEVGPVIGTYTGPGMLGVGAIAL